MKKWPRRILGLLLVLVLGTAAFLITSYWLIHRTPAWYRPLAMGSKEMEAAANRAFNKAVAIHNMAAAAASQASSAQYARDRGQRSPARGYKTRRTVSKPLPASGSPPASAAPPSMPAAQTPTPSRPP